MATMPLCAFTLACSLLALSLANEHMPVAVPEEVFAGEDECLETGGHDSACALSALQRRGAVVVNEGSMKSTTTLPLIGELMGERKNTAAAKAVQGYWQFVESPASGAKSQPHCHPRNYNPMCTAALEGKEYFANKWDIIGGDVLSISDCAGGWIYDGPKSVNKKFTCTWAPTTEGDWQFVESPASGSKSQPHCHPRHYSPTCTAAHAGKEYFANKWDVIGGDVQSLSDCAGGWMYHGSKSVNKKFTCTWGYWQFVESPASGSKSQPHCHPRNYNPTCTAAHEGKEYFANKWDVIGGDVRSLSDCRGGWISDGHKSVNKKFTCTWVPTTGGSAGLAAWSQYLDSLDTEEGADADDDGDASSPNASLAELTPVDTALGHESQPGNGSDGDDRGRQGSLAE